MRIVMITSDIFYRHFDEGFSESARRNGLTRMRGNVSRWSLAHRTGALQFNFQINPKASAMPNIPGHFWPIVQWEGQRYNERDTGLVSWFQYSSESESNMVQNLRRHVIEKADEQLSFDNDPHSRMVKIMVEGLHLDLDIPLLPNFPQPSLFYLDKQDCTEWGSLFGRNLAQWLARFDAAPETLESWCWRVLWKDRSE